MPSVEIKHFSILIENKPFFNQPIKFVEMSANDNFLIGNILHYLYRQSIINSSA